MRRGWLTYVGYRASDMLQFLEEMDVRYRGGVDGFAKEKLDLTEEDLERVRKNLRGLN